MKESIRRVVMLCTILTLGTILIFFDVTLIQLLLLLIVAVTALPFLLGIVTVAELKAYLANLKKSGLLKRLDEIKLFEKRAPSGTKKEAKKPEKPVKKEAPKTGEKTGGLKAHFASIAASLGSLGTILKERGKRGKKVEDINKMLDKTVSEKVNKPAPPTPGAGGGAAAAGSAPTGGSGAGADASDPFLSLSGDEFDEGLLDGLDDDPSLAALSDDLNQGAGSSPDSPAPELLMPSLDDDGESVPAAPADAGSGSGLDGLSSLEGSSELDAEFGDLDNLSLDDVELDEDMADSMDTESAGAAASEEPAPSAAPSAPAPDPNVVKTAWIPSDAPAGAESQDDQLGIQSDMASFAGGSGGSDEDLLSSIASDVKTVKKEKDVSLLRELKDFKAPATEIEDELKDMYQKIGGIGKEKDKPTSDGIK